ncbi:RWD domain-containing protein 2A [Zerene cesonia]|uniref:RWD domain-containing protein 2A n=1 Tax=Zerene cesonia TaxID=33412 RepID=UPI0018E5733E|nr:RWD domain-containing protein 2A [Zerene cesonia]
MESDEMKKKLFSCLTQQMSEIELLNSMYPNKDELSFTDTSILQEVKDFLEDKTDYTPRHIDFVLYLFLQNMKLEISINLPTFYPDDEPDIYIRCNQMNRQQESRLNRGAMDFIKSTHNHEACIYSIVAWIQENIEQFTEVEKNSQELIDENTKYTEEVKFARYWIFSHHIYNKKKREEIVKLARELKLTGFCLSGKPGIICIEGSENDCKEWWKVIKSMNWKKIVVRKIELFELSFQAKEQRFSKFEEIIFQNASSRTNKHADMSGFSKYMEEYNLTEAFNDFFGFDNNT